MNLDLVKRFYKLDKESLLEEIEKLEKGFDTYFSRETLLRQLKEDYFKWGRLIIAYDFDDTVCPNNGENCDSVVHLLQLCSKISDFDMVCFTARSNTPMIDEAIYKLDKLQIRHDVINENIPRVKNDVQITRKSKIYYNIFLDDRAGLEITYDVLKEFVVWYLNQTI